MNNNSLKLYHEIMKKGWIDRNEHSLIWNCVEDEDARDELDQMGKELQSGQVRLRNSLLR